MTGVVFPGQGAQRVGMGRAFYEEFQVARETFEEASDVLSLDLKKLCFEGDEATLALTHNTQPALLAASTMTYRVLQETTEFAPLAGAGHSVGEYAAAVTSGALAFAQGIELVRRRGQLMQEAVPVGEGAMLAVLGLGEEQVQKLCTWAMESSGLKPLEPANFNSPGQIVVSGNAKLIQWLRDNFQAETAQELGFGGKKVRLIPLKVSAPFHCSMMTKAEEGMAAALETVPFSQSAWPIAQNITGAFFDQGEDIKKNLVLQITGAVKWTHCMQTLQGRGVTHLVECGPGKVLAGLAKKINPELKCWAMNSLEDLKAFEKERAL